MKIRLANKTDINSVQEVVNSAFPKEESELISNLAEGLILDNSTPKVKSLVCELDGVVAGYISFSPLFFEENIEYKAYILSPVGVLSTHQKQGIGKKLIKEGIKLLSEENIDFILVYGDPAYYGKFEFKKENSHFFNPPYPLKYPEGWLVLALNKENTLNSKATFKCVNALNKSELW